MYKKETIRKAAAGLRAATTRYHKLILEHGIDVVPMAISKGNRKIGRVMNVSLPPILTCANCSECMYLCYDIKACNQYPGTVIDARARNLAVLLADRDEYFRRIDAAISRRRKHKFFRWHVAGDIVDIDYLARMVDIARRHPDFIFWTYTKNYAVVNQYVRDHGGDRAAAIPENLSIMFSEWRGMPMDNPYSFPEFSVVFKSDPVKPVGHYCPGNCDVCKAGHRGCIAGETTYCNEH